MSKHKPDHINVVRRNLVQLGLLSSLAPGLALAANYPSRPVKIVIGFVPGGATDFGARILADALAKELGVPFIVENKPGATGLIGSKHVAGSTPDGYTLLVGTPTPIVVAPNAIPDSGFNPITDLAPINIVSMQPYAFAVNPKLGVHRMSDLVALSRTRVVTVGVAGTGGLLDLLVEYVRRASGGSFQAVPYKGSGPSLTDAMAGHIDAVASDVGSFLPLHTSGKLLIAGIAAEERLAMLPDVPTINEDIPGITMLSWLGVFAPAKTPKPILDTLNAALQKVVRRDDVRTVFAKSAVTATALSGPEEFGKLVASEYERYGTLLKEMSAGKDK